MKSKKYTPLNGWKIIFAYFKEYRKDIILLSFIGIVSALGNGLIPYITGRFFDFLVTPGDVFLLGISISGWLFFLTFFVIVQITADIVDWVNELKSRYIATALFASYKARATGILLRLPVSFHKNRKSGQTWDKIGRAANAIDQIIGQIVIQIAPQLLSVIVGFVVAFVISPILAGILLLGVMIYIITLFKISEDYGQMVRRGNKAWGKAHNVAYEAFSNAYTVKHSTAENFESKRINNYFVNKALNVWFEVEKLWSNMAFYQRIIVTITRGIIFLLSVFLVGKGGMSIGGLIALNGYAGMVFGPFIRMGYNWHALQTGLASVEEAENILSLSQENYGQKKNSLPIKGDIDFNGVSFGYKRGQEILSNINFSVKKGEIIALVGESGVGKSTLIDLISGYYAPTKGKVLIDGVGIEKIGLHNLRKQIALVPQETVLFNETIEANIIYGADEVESGDVEKAAQKAKANIFIEKFPQKYKQIVGERGVKLSVGQKQRVAIARAILRNPKILILDEPTSALDSQTEREISESLQELMNGRTTFIIAHRLSTVRHADKILVIEGGKIVEQGKHDELMSIPDGRYKKIYELHIGLT